MKAIILGSGGHICADAVSVGLSKLPAEGSILVVDVNNLSQEERDEIEKLVESGVDVNVLIGKEDINPEPNKKALLEDKALPMSFADTYETIPSKYFQNPESKQRKCHSDSVKTYKATLKRRKANKVKNKQKRKK